MRDALQVINSKIKNFNDPISTGNQASLKQIAAALDNDIDTAVAAARPDLAGALSAANTYYKAGVAKLDSTFGKTIASHVDTPDRIVDLLIRPSTSVDDIPKIYEVIGEEGRKAIQATFVEKLFEGARSKTTGTFTPSGLTSQIQKYGREKLQAILPLDNYNALIDLEKRAKALGRGQRTAEGSQTFFLARMAGYFGLVFTNPLLILKTLISDVAFSKFIQSKAGQNFLGQGIPLTGSTGRAVQRGSNVVSKGVPIERLVESQNQSP